MNYEERRDLIDKLAQKMTDDCPTEALMQHFYNDQYEWLRELDDDELLDKKIEEFGEKEDHTCPKCHGTGEGFTEYHSCGNCRGTGEIKND